MHERRLVGRFVFVGDFSVAEYLLVFAKLAHAENAETREVEVAA
jgi:hypothetical protein